jgi:hypothetical protein
MLAALCAREATGFKPPRNPCDDRLLNTAQCSKPHAWQRTMSVTPQSTLRKMRCDHCEAH